MMRRVVLLVLGVGSLAAALAYPHNAAAQQAVSPAYSVDEVFFGTGGELEACSTAYCSKQGAGETAVGNAVSPAYQTQAGHNTDREVYLEFIVNASTTNLGVLSPSTAATTTGTFSVKTYLASGYTVVNASDPPRTSSGTGHTLTNLTSPTASSPGTEQFGINLVANTVPASLAGVSASPVQVPDSTFSFGAAATGYDTANQFKYVKGDVIASSTKSSGTTNYTVSYLYNISNSTPSGEYLFRHDMVATSTY